ncbi:MAG: hypothetical protein AAF465_05665 [Pseudomonadota bacterium]
MTDKAKISTLEADKERLLDALRQLRAEGVMLIDDRVGRPAVLPPRKRATVEPQRDGRPVDPYRIEGVDKLSIADGSSDTDPYNSRIK